MTYTLDILCRHEQFTAAVTGPSYRFAGWNTVTLAIAGLLGRAWERA